MDTAFNSFYFPAIPYSLFLIPYFLISLFLISLYIYIPIYLYAGGRDGQRSPVDCYRQKQIERLAAPA